MFGWHFQKYEHCKGTFPKKINGIFWEFFPKGGGVFAIPKTILYLPFHFLYAETWKFWGGSRIPKSKNREFFGGSPIPKTFDK